MRWLCWWRPPCLLRTVILNLIPASDGDTAIRGVLWQSRGPWLILRHAELLKPNQTPTAIDGEVIVPRSQLHFLQVVD